MTSEGETYGQKMRRLRRELGLSMREVAEAAGVATETIQLWETGRRYGLSTEAAAVPRHVIKILMQRLRRRAREHG